MTVQAPRTATGVFDRILCGVDGTPESLEAARQGARLRSLDGTLELVGVTDVNVAVHAGYAMGHVLEQLGTEIREGLERGVNEVKPTNARLLAGAVAPCLLKETEQTRATLVAVGPRGHSRAAGMLLGGVATELLHNAPCSVLLARRSRGFEFPSRIIVGVDGSPESLAAAAVAKSIAERFDAECLIVAARGGHGFEIEPIQALTPYFIVDPGHPVEALTELSAGADLVVLGSRGLHGLRALGSVSERVAHKAACSVLVVRNQKEEP
jgi:nucleotide-binding universal stress UspA family protein